MIEEKTRPAMLKPHRCRFQYSLRTLLLLVSLGGPVIGWIGIAVKNHLRRPTAVEQAMQWLKEHQRPEDCWAESVTRSKSPVNPAGEGNSVRRRRANVRRWARPLSQEKRGKPANKGQAAKSGCAGSTSLTAVLAVGLSELQASDTMTSGPDSESLDVLGKALSCWGRKFRALPFLGAEPQKYGLQAADDLA